jgi:hypothetical protein
MPNRREIFKELLKQFLIGYTDPVKECKLYKDQSCSHVDGFLCQYNTCQMRKDYESNL